MQSRVEFHPGTKVAAYAAVSAVVVVLALLGLKRLTGDDPPVSVARPELSITTTEILIPVVELSTPDPALESSWSKALAANLSGTTEHAVEHGRVDVLTDRYAIEVDRLDKWHEAIGQAAHYGHATEKSPVVALFLPSAVWPLTEATKDKLSDIDEVCAEQRIKLIILRHK